MVISIQKHILAQEIETCPEELSFAALGQVCPQHQIWANSFPKPLSAMGTMWHQCLLLQGWTLGKPKESGSKWQWGLWGHRHTGLPPWWVISTAWLSKKLEKSELANQLEKKWLRKAPPTKESSGNKWNFPGDPTPVFAQVCYLHTACNNNSHPQCTALRKNQDSSNFTHLLQEKAGTSASASILDKKLSTCGLALQPSQTCIFIEPPAPFFTSAYWTSPASSWPQKQGQNLASRISHSKNSTDATVAAFIWRQ